MRKVMVDDRAAAEEFDCPYFIPWAALTAAARHRLRAERAKAGDDPAKSAGVRCGALAHSPCRIPGTDLPLRGQAAHRPRLELAGVAPAPRMSSAYT